MRALRSTAGRLAWEALWRVAVLAIGLVAVHKQVRDGNDFPIYWQAARDLFAGRSPYDIASGLHGYVYLPWFALLLVPLAWLPLPVAAWTWYVANVVFLGLAGRTLLATLREVVPGAESAWLWAAALPLTGLALDNLMLGQANLFLLALVALGIGDAMRERPRERGGLALGFAAALKMPASVLVVPLMVHGSGRAVFGFLLGVLLAVAVPLLPLGPDRSVELLRDWHAKVVAPAAAGTLQGSKVIDQSPQAALRRLLVAEPAYEGHAVNVAALDPRTMAAVGRVMSALILAAYAFVWGWAPARGSPRARLLDLALGCCAMVQLTGFNLRAQFVVLLLPAWLAATLARERPALAPRVLLVAAGALFFFSQSGVVGRAASNWLLAYSSMTLGTLLLAGTLAWFRWQITPPPSAAPVASPAAGTAP
jgi:hypothetical protein